MHYPAVIQNLINDFASLPGIGQKSAERLVFYLLKKGDRDKLDEFSKNLSNVMNEVKGCIECGNYMANEKCEICNDTKRDKSRLCIVAEVQDIYYLDKTHELICLYHVLNGLISPAEGMTPDKLNIESLVKRLAGNGIQEVVLGLNPTIEGESTIIYLKKILKEKFPNLKITRLSRGLPMGGDLEYADEITLLNAIKNRNEV